MATGAQTQLKQLIELRHSVGDLRLFARSKALSQLAGDIKTQFRGRGLDFEEIRQYQPGDDIRAIDWRVTARTGTAHTKLYQEERERPVLVAVDQRQSMAFGSRCCFKSVQAAELASLLSWAALAQNDRIGGLVFNDSAHHDIRPARSKSAVLQLLSSINRFNTTASISSTANPDMINEAIIDLRRIAKPGSAIFVISDFIGLNQEGIKQLHLLKKHCDINALFISDPMEQHLPRGAGGVFGDAGSVFTDGIKRRTYNLADPQLRQDFAAGFESRWQQLKQQLGSHDIPVLAIGTDQDAGLLLRRYYQANRRRKRNRA